MILFILVFVSCGAAMAQEHGVQTAPAAQAESEITPLKIGDKIPDELWDLPLQVVNHPEGKDTITLNDYRGKLIILDFWATWCGSCIAAMPQMKSIQNKFREDVKVVFATSDKEDAVENFLLNNNLVKDLDLFSIVNAPILKQSFPFVTVPHYAWINSQGIFIASTVSEDINDQNIVSALAENELSYTLKTFIDLDKPLLFEEEKLPKNVSIAHYSVFIKGGMPSLPGSSKNIKKENKVYGKAVYNKSIGSIYYSIAIDIIGRDVFSKQLVVYDLDSAIYPEIFPLSSSANKRKNEDLWTYEYRVPFEQSDSLYHFILADINRFSGFNGRLEKRSTNCLILTLIGDSSKLITKNNDKIIRRTDDTYLQSNYPLSQIVKYLGSVLSPSIIIDETGLRQNVDIVLQRSESLQDWNRELRRHGLKLIEATREVDFFIVSKT